MRLLRVSMRGKTCRMVDSPGTQEGPDHVPSSDRHTLPVMDHTILCTMAVDSTQARVPCSLT